MTFRSRVAAGCLAIGAVACARASFGAGEGAPRTAPLFDLPPASPVETPRRVVLDGAHPLFDVALGANGKLGGEEQNTFLLPCGGGPASIDVDLDGRWWVLDAIGGRIVVFDPDGKWVRNIALVSAAPVPAGGGTPRKSKKGAYAYHADLAVDSEGGVFVLDATGRRVERYSADGKPAGGFGREKLPRSKGIETVALDLPERIALSGGDVYVEDGGTDSMIRFAPDGTFRAAFDAPGAVPVADGALFAIGAETGNGMWLEYAPDGGHRRPISRLAPTAGKELRDARLVGVMGGEAVVAQTEAAGDEPERVRLVRIDGKGVAIGERILPLPGDGARPSRRFRVTPGGRVAWFRIEGGKFQAFEADLEPIPLQAPREGLRDEAKPLPRLP